MQTLEQLAADLREILGAENVLVREPLSAHTTFQIGGPAQILVTPTTVEQVCQAYQAARAADLPLHILGLGSNVLVSDEGVPGVVIKLAEKLSAISFDGTRAHCQAGASNKAVADAALARGLAGYEFASGIPGSIGGAAIMNAGAYGGEFADVALSAECLTPEGELVTIDAQDAQWGYRHSLMMDRGYVVLGAVLQLHEDDPEAIRERMEDLRQRREEKQPLEMPSAGSTFKRPEGYFAGKLIQDAGLRGYRVGGAQVSEKHTGFVVNAGGATAADVVQLIHDVQDRVWESAGVHMEPEVRMWGFN